MSHHKHLFEKRWKMNRDPQAILGGVKGLEFELKLLPGSGAPRYEFVHEAEDPADDPFEKTVFTEWGDVVPVTPHLKLKKWNGSEERNYRRVIREKLGSPNLRIVRLTGEKVFQGNTEWLTVFLIPGAVEPYPGTLKHLIYVTCRTEFDAAPHSFRHRLQSLFFQDGTAHGNPK
jgi:hypothetical protein